ncbi:MAG: glycosyltransferase 87 family protein [Pseudomonadota bacterium]
MAERPWVAHLIVAAALLVVVAYQFAHRGAAADIDTRYLYAAGRCLAQGASPYNLDAFAGCWRAATGAEYQSSFVFLPVALLLAWPMGLMEWAEARTFLQAVQVAAVGLLALCLIRIARPLGVIAALWVAFGLTNTGVLGTIFVGQVGVVATLGAALCAVAALGGRGWWLVPGTVLATAKPHLTVLVVALCWLWRVRRHVAAKLVALGALAVLALALWTCDPQIVANYQASFAEHVANPASRIGRADELYGVNGLMKLMTGTQWVIAAVLLIAAGIASALPLSGHGGRLVALIGLASVIGVMAFPHKGYDFVAYALTFSAAARLPWAFQAAAVLPMLVVWRPQLVVKLGWPVIEFTDLCLIAVAVLFAGAALRVPGIRRA